MVPTQLSLIGFIPMIVLSSLKLYTILLDRRGETSYYPHCSATVETRGESVFAARNTTVFAGKVFINLRADFPHDNWWREAVLAFPVPRAHPMVRLRP
jgi:hypothetical protein